MILTRCAQKNRESMLLWIKVSIVFFVCYFICFCVFVVAESRQERGHCECVHCHVSLAVPSNFKVPALQTVTGLHSKQRRVCTPNSDGFATGLHSKQRRVCRVTEYWDLIQRISGFRGSHDPQPTGMDSSLLSLK